MVGVIHIIRIIVVGINSSRYNIIVEIIVGIIRIVLGIIEYY